VPGSSLRSIDIGGGERVPRLSDALSWASEHDLCLNIEVKSDLHQKRRLLEAVARCLSRETHASERLLLSSFHPGFVRALSQALPALGVCWLVHAKQRLLKFGFGYRWLGAIGVNPEHSLLAQHNVLRWKRSGALIGTWTVNQPDLALHYATLGVDAIISDAPGKILQALAARPC
jgi:glycerophosphoryl diester phosphodiesterase